MEIKLDTVYRTLAGKELTAEKAAFNNVRVVSATSVFVILTSEETGEEMATKRKAFERVYEIKPLEALKPEEKIGHIFKKASYALTALSTLSQNNPKLVGDPNMIIMNNTLHEVMLLTSPVPTSLTEQYEAGLAEEEAPMGLDFLEIEDDVA